MSFSLRALHAQLLAAASRLSFADSYQQLRSNAGTPLPANVPALLDALHSRGRSPSWKNDVLRSLVRAASDEKHVHTATTLIILALWPGLAVLQFRLRQCYPHDRAEFDGDLVGRLALAIRALDLSRVDRIAATLLLNVARDVRRDIARNATVTPQSDPMIADGEALWHSRSMTDYDTGRDALLAELAPLIGADAGLVVEVAVDGASQIEAAETLGISHDAARKRYQRAMSRLGALA